MAAHSATTASSPASGPMAPPKPIATMADAATSAILRRCCAACCTLLPAPRAKFSCRYCKPASNTPPSMMTAKMYPGALAHGLAHALDHSTCCAPFIKANTSAAIAPAAPPYSAATATVFAPHAIFILFSAKKERVGSGFFHPPGPARKRKTTGLTASIRSAARSRTRPRSV